MSELVTTLDRNNLRIHKYQKRVVSDVFYTNDQTAAVAASVYGRLSTKDTHWKRTYEMGEWLIVHSYRQPVSDVVGDAYTIVCGWGEGSGGGTEYNKDNSGRRVVSALSCHSIIVPDELKNPDLNVNNADFGDLTIDVYGDQWLGNGCILAAFFSNDEVPPEFSDLLEKMNTPSGEKKINDYYAGYLGSAPDDPNAIRYIRTGVICATSQQGSNVPISERDGERQPLIFKLHDWGVAEYDEATGHYNFKSYIHLMLFLVEEQYISDRIGWMEGSALLNISNIVLSVTEQIECPIYLRDICTIDNFSDSAVNDGGESVAVDLQGKLFGLVNIFKMMDGQAAKLSKSNGELCVWQAIESAVRRIHTANAIYGKNQYPPVTSSGFDFFVVESDGTEHVRIGCADENAMNFESDVPSPSVYGLVIGYPVNPGVYQRTFTSLIITEALKEFSSAVTLAIVIYQATRGATAGRSGANYGFNSSINVESFKCKEFFNGDSEELILDDGEKIQLKKAYFGYFSEIADNERILFDYNMLFTQPGAIIIGVCPIDFTRHGEMVDGEWATSMTIGYNSQYMQLVEWPIGSIVKVEEIE